MQGKAEDDGGWRPPRTTTQPCAHQRAELVFLFVWIAIAHTKWKCQYHIVFIPKYRKKVLYGKVKDDVREVIRTLCKYKNVEIIEGAVCIDHVHLCLSIPPKMSISEFMGYLKGKSALMIYDRHPELGNKWDRSFWARGYYVSTIGNVDEATIRKYIKEQEEESYNESRATK